MKTRSLAFSALILVTLAACWGPVKPGSSGDAGTAGQGGSGGDTCASCGDVVLSGRPSTTLCNTSANFFESLQTCACDQGPCGATCYNSLCSGAAADTDCKTCLQSMCATNYAVCAKDTSH
jgi:hypothetical protein